MVFSRYSAFLHHDITGIWLKMALNTITLTPINNYNKKNKDYF
jgi:hypothetical protein